MEFDLGKCFRYLFQWRVAPKNLKFLTDVFEKRRLKYIYYGHIYMGKYVILRILFTKEGILSSQGNLGILSSQDKHRNSHSQWNVKFSILSYFFWEFSEFSVLKNSFHPCFKLKTMTYFRSHGHLLCQHYMDDAMTTILTQNSFRGLFSPLLLSPTFSVEKNLSPWGEKLSPRVTTLL